jgi:hypothetical protein
MKFRLASLALAFTLLVPFLGLVGCGANRPPATAPSASAVTAKVLTVVTRVGTVVEQVQAAEIAMFAAGNVPEATHRSIQATFQKTSGSVLAALAALEHLGSATNTRDLVQAVAQGLKDLSVQLARLSAKQAAQLAGWVDTAAALIEVSLQ